MKKTMRVWLITAAALILMGFIIFGGLMNMLKWDFRKLSTSKYETNQYEISETFCNISVATDTADITFVLSDDGKCRVECFEDEKEKHSVCIEDDTLVIKAHNRKAWYDHIGFYFSSPKITIYLPETEYMNLEIHESTGNISVQNDFMFDSVSVVLSTGNVNWQASASGVISIKASTGKINVDNVSAGALELTTSTGGITVTNSVCEGNLTMSVSTGKTNLTNIQCRNLISNGSTGNITVNRVIAAEKFTMKRSTGDIKFDGSDAAEIFVETSTGNVTGTFLSQKVFLTETDTGRVNVPQSTTGGTCEITTNTGNIKLNIQ